MNIVVIAKNDRDGNGQFNLLRQAIPEAELIRFASLTDFAGMGDVPGGLLGIVLAVSGGVLTHTERRALSVLEEIFPVLKLAGCWTYFPLWQERVARFPEGRQPRWEKRLRLHEHFIIVAGDKESNATSIDISLRGCFVLCTPDNLEAEEEVSFLLPDRTPMDIRGVVRWRTAWGVPGRLPGVGIEFEHIGTELGRIIRKATG